MCTLRRAHGHAWMHGHGRGEADIHSELSCNLVLSAGKASWDRAKQIMFSDVIRKLRSIPQPVVAAVHGAAAGGGMSIALAADVRYRRVILSQEAVADGSQSWRTHAWRSHA